MRKDRTINEFNRFLKKNKCHDIYYSHVNNVRHNYMSKEIGYGAVVPSSIIRSAFVWHEAPGGDNFWRNIDKKWIEYKPINNITISGLLKLL